MPSRPCKHPTCTAHVPMQLSTRYCRGHHDQTRSERRDRDRVYDRTRRDPEAVKFYNSAAWKSARDAIIAAHPVCERCNAAWSELVHHRVELAACTPEQRTDPENLQAVCWPCHAAIHAGSA